MADWLDSKDPAYSSGSGFGNYGYQVNPTAPPAGSNANNTGGSQSGTFAETFNAVTSGTSNVLNAVAQFFSFGKKTDSGMPLPPEDSDDYTGGSGTGSWDTKKILLITVVVLSAVAAVVGGIFLIRKHKKA